MERMHTVVIDDVVLSLPIRSVSPKLDICLFNPFNFSAKVIGKLANKLKTELKKQVSEGTYRDIYAVVVPEAKAITLAYELSKQMYLPLIVLRKNRKSYMLNATTVKYNSITSGKSQLVMDGENKEFLSGKTVITVDDVHSTGATLRAMDTLLSQANIKVAKHLSIFTEGSTKHKNLLSLGNLPVFEKTFSVERWD